MDSKLFLIQAHLPGNLPITPWVNLPRIWIEALGINDAACERFEAFPEFAVLMGKNP